MEKMRQHTSHSQTRTELRHPHFVYMSGYTNANYPQSTIHLKLGINRPNYKQGQHGSNYGMKDHYQPSQVPDKLPTFGKVRHSIKVPRPRETGISTKKDPNRDLVSTSTAITDTGQVSNTAMTSTRIQRWPDPTSMAGTFIPTYNLVSTILPGSQVCREPTTHQTRFKIIHWN